MNLGLHVLADVDGASPAVLSDLDTIRRVMVQACEVSGAEVLDVVEHHFPPMPGHDVGGVTMVALLSESHASIHTYPEHGVYMLDVFTCGAHTDPGAAVAYVVEQLGGVVRERGAHPRGRLVGPAGD